MQPWRSVYAVPFHFYHVHFKQVFYIIWSVFNVAFGYSCQSLDLLRFFFPDHLQQCEPLRCHRFTECLKARGAAFRFFSRDLFSTDYSTHYINTFLHVLIVWLDRDCLKFGLHSSPFCHASISLLKSLISCSMYQQLSFHYWYFKPESDDCQWINGIY